MLAKALAGESGVNFLQATAAGFQNKYVGESEENIRRLFQRAKSFVFVLAATNYDAGVERSGIAPLDEALLRRFDRRIQVDLPKESERKEYILRMRTKKHMEGISEAAAQSIAERTTGQSLAILENVLDLAFRGQRYPYGRIQKYDRDHRGGKG